MQKSLIQVIANNTQGVKRGEKEMVKGLEVLKNQEVNKGKERGTKMSATALLNPSSFYLKEKQRKEIEIKKKKLEFLTCVMTEVAKIHMLMDYMEKVCLDMNLSYSVLEVLEIEDTELIGVDTKKLQIIKDSIAKLSNYFTTQGITNKDDQFKKVDDLKLESKRSLKSIRNKAIIRAIEALEKEGLEVLNIDLLALKDGFSTYVTAVYSEEEMKEIIWEDIFRV